MSDFAGKVAIVMGASSPGGIGEETAGKLARGGAKVVVSGLGKENLDHVAEKIGGVAYEADATREDEVKALVDFTIDKFGHLDLGVNHAGVSIISSIKELTPDLLEKMTQINYYATVWFIKSVAEKIAEGGAIVTTSALSAYDFVPHIAAYASAKRAADHFVMAAAVEYSDKRLRINSVAPSVVDTPMMKEGAKQFGVTFDELVQPFVDLTPLRRMCEPHDVSAMVCMMLRDEFFETGQVLFCTGGSRITGQPRSLSPR